MPPNETLFLESTCKIFKDDISNNSFINFQIWDIPGQIDFFDGQFDFDAIFAGTGALIFVIDAQDDYMEALGCLHQVVSKAYAVNPRIKFETFIHKVDGLTDDNKIETQRDISKRANEDLNEANLTDLNLSFYLTSIYDHSIFEAFSKVVQKQISQLSTLENLLSIFVQNSGVEKTFLFDVVSKIYIATDGSPVDMQSYELCCEMIDVMIDITCLYGKDESEYTSEQDSTCIIRLSNSNILYLREITRFLVLVSVLRNEAFHKRDVIDYNILCLQESIKNVFSVTVKHGSIGQPGTYNNHQQQHNGTNAVRPLVGGNELAIDKTMEGGSSSAVVVVGAAGDNSISSQTPPVPLV